MSHVRLQVLIPPSLDARLRKAAARARVSKGEWVRRAMERTLSEKPGARDPLDRLASLSAPTADPEQMLAEIEAGRG
ncbi:MAG TPA: antitoxin [Thermoanaerobaculia bacterium]|nr:antitoxin [Thermoanaerobaculia bacterium]